MPEYDDYGYLKNGQDLLIVPLGSGGSGGVFYALLFTGVTSSRPRFVGYVPSTGGHLDAHIAEGRLVVSTPNYGPGDPNCCPSGHTVTTYALNGITLAKIESHTEK